MAIHFAGIGYGLDPESCKASNHGHRSKTGKAKAEETAAIIDGPNNKAGIGIINKTTLYEPFGPFNPGVQCPHTSAPWNSCLANDRRTLH